MIITNFPSSHFDIKMNTGVTTLIEAQSLNRTCVYPLSQNGCCEKAPAVPLLLTSPGWWKHSWPDFVQWLWSGPLRPSFTCWYYTLASAPHSSGSVKLSASHYGFISSLLFTHRVEAQMMLTHQQSVKLQLLWGKCRESPEFSACLKAASVNSRTVKPGYFIITSSWSPGANWSWRLTGDMLTSFEW